MTFKKASRKDTKIKVVICSRHESRMTFAALSLAKGMGNKIAVIDTQGGSSNLYATVFNFDSVLMHGRFNVKELLDLVEQAEKRYDVLVIDTVSPFWSEHGGLLERHGKEAEQLKSSFRAFNQINPEYYNMITALKTCNINLIMTLKLRSKWVQYKDEIDNKLKYKKDGYRPVQRPGFENNFLLHFDMTEPSCISKIVYDIPGIFQGLQTVLLNQDTGIKIKNWIDFKMPQTEEKGKAEPPHKQEETPPEDVPPSNEASKEVKELKLLDEIRDSVQHIESLEYLEEWYGKKKNQIKAMAKEREEIANSLIKKRKQELTVKK